MKHINSFEKHNESWRQAKAYLRLPGVLVDTVMSKILDYVQLNNLYASMAAKIDTGTSFNSGPGTTMKDDMVKITIDDIKDDKVKRALKLSGLFNNWNVYKIDDRRYDGKTPIYISKDELKKGDPIHGERIRQDDETEFYVVAAKHTSEHDDMKVERSNRFEKRQYSEFKSKVDKAIKNNYLMTRTSGGDFSPLFHNLIKKGYADLVKKCLDSVKDPIEKRNIIVNKYDGDGDLSKNGGNSLMLKTTDEIKELLNKTLYELWLEKNNKDNETK